MSGCGVRVSVVDETDEPSREDVSAVLTGIGILLTVVGGVAVNTGVPTVIGLPVLMVGLGVIFRRILIRRGILALIFGALLAFSRLLAEGVQFTFGFLGMNPPPIDRIGAVAAVVVMVAVLVAGWALIGVLIYRWAVGDLDEKE